MKTTLAIALIAISTIGTPAAAGDSCAEIGQLGHTIMTARQEGIPQSELRAALAQLGISETAAEGTIMMIQAAYAEPQMYSENSKSDMAQRFQIELENACYNQ